MTDMNHSDALQNPVLIVNCGSSSIKYALIGADATHRIEGLAENLGTPDARIKHKSATGDKSEISIPDADHTQALQSVLEQLGDVTPVAVGHRVVHGGDVFGEATKVTLGTLAEVKNLSALAPLHNPANLAGIEAVTSIYPDLPQVMVFDTAFHQTMPEVAYRYAIPKNLYTDHAIRRYGFHGTSHAFVSNRASKLSTSAGNRDDKKGWLTAHLGNGCSVTAVYDGNSMDSSMGLTPLEGLMMGTRSGDVDPGLHGHLHRTLDMDLSEIDTMLNKKSGLLGVSTVTNDMRTIEEMASDASHEHHADAKLALEMFCYRAGRYLASLSCALPEMTGIVFTGGIGENSSTVRAKIVGVMRQFGLKIDEAKNEVLIRGEEGSFHSDDSRYELWVIPTDEEYRICEETRAVLDL